MSHAALTWNRFCDSMDAHRRGLAKIQKKNEQLRKAAAAEIRRAIHQASMPVTEGGHAR